MIETLRGILTLKRPTMLVVECGGVGLGVQVSLNTSQNSPEIGQTIQLLTHLVVREDALQLFGFASAGEKELFLRLIEVSGVGPKLALRILSETDPATFLGMIATGDIKGLTGLKGIGRKTAEMLLVGLKDSAAALLAATGQALPGSTAPTSPAQQEAVLALLSLGVKEPLARKAVEKAAALLGMEASVSQLVPEALRHL